LKTTKVHRLLWHLNAMWKCYTTSVNQSYIIVELSLFSTVPTRWCNSPYSNECSARNVCITHHFSWRWSSMACMFTWSLCLWLIFMGVSQKKSFHL
jgi:hypothetical protein